METENSLLKSQYELLNRSVRISQKLIDRDVGALNTAEKQRWDNREESISRVDKLLNKLESLKEKIEEADVLEDRIVDMLRERIGLVEASVEAETPHKDAPVFRKRTDRLVGNFLLQEGFFEVAQALARERHIEALIDSNIHEETKVVLDALATRNCTPGLNWCAANRSKLRKFQSVFEFNLRLQEYIELIRKNETKNALEYARKHFGAFADTCMQDINLAMGLLIFPWQNDKNHRYSVLMSEDRWDFLQDQFREEIATVYSLPDMPLLVSHIQAGLSVLKTPYCLDDESRNTNCPTCSEPFRTMAAPLPFAHHSQSRLVCRISGKVMDSDNPPMALPNGMVYSQEALEAMAAANAGTVTCPRTRETFQMDDVRKVFIM